MDLCCDSKILKPLENEPGGFLTGDGKDTYWKSPSVERKDCISVLKGVSPLELKNVELLDFDEHIPLHACPNPDVSRDELVNLLDFVRVGSNFGGMYSPIPGVPTAPTMPLASLNLGDVDSAYLPFFQEMAVELDNHPLANPREFVRARMLLDKLTIAKAPEETRLLSNFPNPFNPEAWIPFELAKPSDVTVSIYNLRGQLVRTFGLGELQAGDYNDRSSAVYWDGKSEIGVSVSSGLYFYHRKAENLSATSQMVIMK